MTVDVPSRGENVIFPCHRWLAEDEDDGLIERELYPSEERVSSKSKSHPVIYVPNKFTLIYCNTVSRSCIEENNLICHEN